MDRLQPQICCLDSCGAMMTRDGFLPQHRSLVHDVTLRIDWCDTLVDANEKIALRSRWKHRVPVDSVIEQPFNHIGTKLDLSDARSGLISAKR
jgi:hypothetical protein